MDLVNAPVCKLAQPVLFIRQKIHYIYYNPVQAEMITNSEVYRYSITANYTGELAPLAAVVLTIRRKT